MARKRKRKILEDIQLEGIAAEGKAIAKLESGKVLFVEDAIPGDVADVLIEKNKTDFAIGRVWQLKQPSTDRIEPFCKYFEACGGCKWQYLNYEKQLAYKQEIVEDVFRRIGKLEIPLIEPILGSEKTTHYRNKMEYTFSHSRWIFQHEIDAEVEFQHRDAVGLHVPKMFQKIVDIEECFLQDTVGDRIRNAVRDYAHEHSFSFYNLFKHTGFLRTLMLRNNKAGEWMVLLAVSEDRNEDLFGLLDMLKEKFPEIASLNWTLNQKKNDSMYDLTINNYAGETFITESLEELNFKISPQSFFQTNPYQALELYRITRDYAQLTGNEIVYDLYTGTGSIAQFVAKGAKKVVGIEEVEPAIADAKINAVNNKIDNCTFLVGDVKNHLNPSFAAEHGQPDVLIVDPPRAGLHAKVVENILAIAPNRIVYVSCNPATQARDVKLLTEKYNLVKIRPVDMFPHTYHIENVALLELK
ncbi:UNVERIFIED_CONTAM: hypothetical protein GTU68_002852 [Idotea baltica]|nr:hypothetical protein [Idotea baltica]